MKDIYRRLKEDLEADEERICDEAMELQMEEIGRYVEWGKEWEIAEGLKDLLQDEDLCLNIKRRSFNWNIWTRVFGVPYTFVFPSYWSNCVIRSGRVYFVRSNDADV